jgi:hypothetical protein
MVAKGNKDAHRYTYSGGVKAQETEKWGRDTAARRYGEPRSPDMQPKDASGPQAPEDKHAANYSNDVKDGWLRGSGGTAENKPNFDHSRKR